jgi:alkanesulfonate monooxygenase SsuD/methylene tetrahydromethanopterin reductase-like flavin-dependent oxidoreductase (luciferase family)
MRLSIFLDPQEGMTWASIQAAARRTEAGGFEGLYRSDHLAPTSGRFERAATEAWTTLAALAGETSRLRLGTLVTPLTFHEPQVLSKMVSTVCEMAPGRVDVSIGTGWNVGEHAALGLEFESLATRFDRLEEYIQVLIGLWGEDRLTYHGRYYQVSGILPRPLPSPRPPIIIGGHGRRKTPLLAARYADEYNVDWPSVEQCGDFFEILADACQEVGREPGTIGRSVLLGVMVGQDEADVARVAQAGVRELGGSDPVRWLADHPGWQAGTPAQIVEWLRGYQAVGVDHVMLAYAPRVDVRTIETLAREVLPMLQGGRHAR